MTRASDSPTPSDGFSTVEMLVAFVILSIGLGLAVQNISQASLSLREAHEREDEKLLVRRTLSEELPRLLRRFDGSPLVLNRAEWDMRVEALNGATPRSPLRVVMRVGRNEPERPTSTYLTVVAPPASSPGD